MIDYNNVKNMLDCEIDNIAKQQGLNDATLSNLYKLVDIRKDLAEIEEKEMEMGGASRRTMYGYYDDGVVLDQNSYGRGRMYYDRGGYGYGNSMNNYGNSMAGSKQNMLDHLNRAMNEASTEQERESIRQVMNKLQNN